MSTLPRWTINYARFWHQQRLVTSCSEVKILFLLTFLFIYRLFQYLFQDFSLLKQPSALLCLRHDMSYLRAYSFSGIFQHLMTSFNIFKCIATDTVFVDFNSP